MIRALWLTFWCYAMVLSVQVYGQIEYKITDDSLSQTQLSKEAISRWILHDKLLKQDVGTDFIKTKWMIELFSWCVKLWVHLNNVTSQSPTCNNRSVNKLSLQQFKSTIRKDLNNEGLGQDGSSINAQKIEKTWPNHQLLLLKQNRIGVLLFVW